LLLAGAVAFLIATANVKTSYGIFAFLAIFVPGVMLATGMLGTPKSVEQLRAIDADATGRSERTTIPSPRTFRYARPRLGVWALAWSSCALMVTLAAFVLVGWPGQKREAVPLVAILALFGLAFPIYVRRHSRLGIRIDEHGLLAQRYFGKITMTWDQVIALRTFGIHVVGAGSAGGVFDVYTRAKKLRFFASIEDLPELLASISGATGLEWRSEA
jgi:hypothetical protein